VQLAFPGSENWGLVEQCLGCGADCPGGELYCDGCRPSVPGWQEGAVSRSDGSGLVAAHTPSPNGADKQSIRVREEAVKDRAATSAASLSLAGDERPDTVRSGRSGGRIPPRPKGRSRAATVGG
jgi:hypothetical protein